VVGGFVVWRSTWDLRRILVAPQDQLYVVQQEVGYSMSASFSPPTEWTLHDSPGEDAVVRQSEASAVVSYCVSAIPASYVVAEDVIIRDAMGRSFLLTSDSSEPLPLCRSELDVLGMAYEPAQDTSWHSARELHRIFFAVDDA
jgi:hypothetical protein